MCVKLRVYEGRLLITTYRLIQDPGIGEWRKEYNYKLHKLYGRSVTVRTLKSGRHRWAGHQGRIG